MFASILFAGFPASVRGDYSAMADRSKTDRSKRASTDHARLTRHRIIIVAAAAAVLVVVIVLVLVLAGGNKTTDGTTRDQVGTATTLATTNDTASGAGGPVR